MSKEQILERERRWARPTALAVLVTVILFVGTAVISSGEVSRAEDSAEFLEAFADDTSRQLLIAILQAIGFALLAFPLFYLFQAASSRSERMRKALIGLTVAGPLFLAIAWITRYFAFDAAASDFVGQMPEPGQSADELADELIEDQAAFGVTQGFNFAGILGLIFGVTYTAFYAMRTGLLTRFWGTLGMALAVATLFLGTPFGVLIFAIAIGLIAADRWPGGRPPAWDAGVGMPWPKPGEEPPEPPADDGAPGLPEGFGSDPAREASPADDGEVPSINGPRKRKRRA